MHKRYFGLILFLLGAFFIFLSGSSLTGYLVLENYGRIWQVFGLLPLIFGLLLMVEGGLEAKVKEEKFDAVIVMGRNWRGYPVKRAISEDGTLRLHSATLMNCSVAADIYRKGKTEKVILATGKTAGKKFNSEAEAMKEYLVKRLKIPEKDILTKHKALDTYTELDDSMKIAKEHELHRLALVTVGTQLPICEKYLGNRVDEYIASEKYAKSLPVWRRYAGKYVKSPLAAYEAVKESILGLLQDIGLTKKFTKPVVKVVRDYKFRVLDE